MAGRLLPRRRAFFFPNSAQNCLLSRPPILNVQPERSGPARANWDQSVGVTANNAAEPARYRGYRYFRGPGCAPPYNKKPPALGANSHGAVTSTRNRPPAAGPRRPGTSLAPSRVECDGPSPADKNSSRGANPGPKNPAPKTDVIILGRAQPKITPSHLYPAQRQEVAARLVGVFRSDHEAASGAHDS